MHKVMLIEDDHIMLSLLSTLLKMEGFDVRTSSDELMVNILSHVQQDPPDLMMIDVNLRQGSGLDLLRQIRRDKQLAALRVLMCSGLNLKDECMRAGANGFILKPFMPDDLINQIRKNLPSDNHPTP